MSGIPLRPVVLPEDPARAVDVLLRSTEDMYDGRHAIAPVTSAAQATELARTVPDGTGVVLSTSGSTGVPKMTVIPRSALLASCSASLNRLCGAGSWLLCLPPGFVAGFQVVSRAVIGGARVTPLDSGRFDAAGFAAAARRLGPGRRYTALVPTQVKRLLADADATAALADFDKVLVGGAPLDHDTAARLREVTDVVVTYGMTETGGGCVYDGQPLDGVRVRIVDGIFHVGGDTVASGYLGAAGEESARFYTDGGRRWFRTSDRGRWDDEGHLIPLGRADDLINTGGVKVSAEAVERILLGVDWVDSAVVMGLPDHEWGELVCAYVVPRAGTTTRDSESLRDRIRGQLGGAALLKKIVFSDDIPLLPNSKIDRSEVRERLRAAVGSAGARDSAHRSMRSRIHSRQGRHGS
ncbi:AMP-binding protein [Streptomyces sp. PSKA54]|uniref:AMP-binding protein n=1 Tax=Streptomyces himalayensis subsp. aureolus TaxID=2758039 RepID=A0A7W2D347_9ACTN|nr:AMP-binding protein [Streptomyces himalayensis]MBA4863771.1 AMP-binding protein [Streptomyces himalayensis subsp. aureolus]